MIADVWSEKERVGDADAQVSKVVSNYFKDLWDERHGSSLQLIHV
jgi:hypothetical protein